MPVTYELSTFDQIFNEYKIHILSIWMEIKFDLLQSKKTQQRTLHINVNKTPLQTLLQLLLCPVLTVTLFSIMLCF